MNGNSIRNNAIQYNNNSSKNNSSSSNSNNMDLMYISSISQCYNEMNNGRQYNLLVFMQTKFELFMLHVWKESRLTKRFTILAWEKVGPSFIFNKFSHSFTQNQQFDSSYFIVHNCLRRIKPSFIFNKLLYSLREV